MKKFPQKNKLETLLKLRNKSFLNSNECRKSNIQIKEFYIELANLDIINKANTFILKKVKENNHEFNILKEKINNNNSYFLLKAGLIWLKIKLENISKTQIQFKIIKKIVIKKTQNGLNKLIEIIKNLKQNNVSHNNIHNYISHYFEYHFKYKKVV